MENDVYRTLKEVGPEALFKERGSKFIGQAFPARSEEEIEENLKELWKKHNKASHICYAWQLGTDYSRYRANDDGEPTNSAGIPIYGQIQHFELTNVLITVIRYYGGTNLGVGGLIQAYKKTAQLALENASIQKRTIKESLTLKFNYPLLDVVMRIIKEENLKISSQTMHLDCQMKLAVRKLDVKRIRKRFENINGVEINSEDR